MLSGVRHKDVRTTDSRELVLGCTKIDLHEHMLIEKLQTSEKQRRMLLAEWETFAAGWLAGWQSEYGCMDSYDSEPSHIFSIFHDILLIYQIQILLHYSKFRILAKSTFFIFFS